MQLPLYRLLVSFNTFSDVFSFSVFHPKGHNPTLNLSGRGADLLRVARGSGGPLSSAGGNPSPPSAVPELAVSGPELSASVSVKQRKRRKLRFQILSLLKFPSLASLRLDVRQRCLQVVAMDLCLRLGVRFS